jgi:hypothetical protein
LKSLKQLRTLLGVSHNSGDETIKVVTRDVFAEKILDSRGEGEVLEIGPLNRPLIEGDFMRYFDILPTSELRSRAASEGLDSDSVPEIHYSDPNGNLTKVPDRFKNIVSSHCLEHQPDLIKHLNEVSDLLFDSESRYWVVIPDKRYCFDALIPESSFIEIVNASFEKRTTPTLLKVIEHRALTTHNDSMRHWIGDHGGNILGLKAKWELAVNEFESAKGSYIDVHCWQFTPESFESTIKNLLALELIKFDIEEVYETPVNSLEFCAILKKVNSEFIQA